MANFIFKEPTKKYDYRHPETEREHRNIQARAKDKEKFLKFENEAEKRDYEKAVGSNPNNIYGTPAFFPPMTLKSSLIGVRPARECECGGCCTYQDNFKCPICGTDNSPID